MLQRYGIARSRARKTRTIFRGPMLNDYGIACYGESLCVFRGDVAQCHFTPNSFGK